MFAQPRAEEQKKENWDIKRNRLFVDLLKIGFTKFIFFQWIFAQSFAVKNWNWLSITGGTQVESQLIKGPFRFHRQLVISSHGIIFRNLVCTSFVAPPSSHKGRSWDEFNYMAFVLINFSQPFPDFPQIRQPPRRRNRGNLSCVYLTSPPQRLTNGFSLEHKVFPFFVGLDGMGVVINLVVVWW